MAQSLLRRYLLHFGGTCFRLGYARAVAEGVIARFTVTTVGVRFSPPEQAYYDRLTDLMGGLRARLVRDHGLAPEPFEDFMRDLALLAAGDGEGSGAARAYRQAMFERRRLLADTPAKDEELTAVAPAVRAADRTIVFTQSIAASERAGRLLRECGLRTEVIHSSRRASGRRDALRRFAVLFVEGTVEDPSVGAHEAFLGEIVDVADQVSHFPASMVAERPGEVVVRPRGSNPEPAYPDRGSLD